MQGLDKHQAVQPVNEIDGFLDQSRVQEQQVAGSVFTEKYDKGKHSRVRRQDDGEKDQGREYGFSILAVPGQDVGPRGMPNRVDVNSTRVLRIRVLPNVFRSVGVLKESQVVAKAPVLGALRF